jgi:hypothetical protein
VLAAGLAALRAAGQNAERMERERALAKLHDPSQADTLILERLGARLVDELTAYLAARAADCATDPDGAAVVARLFTVAT